MFLVLLWNIFYHGVLVYSATDEKINNFFHSENGSSHTSNWAVILDSSKFWFNYRHVANALSIYQSVKRLGLPDSNIILMLADDVACDPRNPYPATVFSNARSRSNIYGDDVEVDYRGYEVTASNLIRVLTGRVIAGTPPNKRLDSDAFSNVLVYLTGHGGVGYLKIQDTSEITDLELADVFQQMHVKRRYRDLLFIIETCKASSMFSYFYSPAIIGLASARQDEESYSHEEDHQIGVHVIDRFSYFMWEFISKLDSFSNSRLNALFNSCPFHKCLSHTVHRTDLFARDIEDVRVTEFFGNVRKVSWNLHEDIVDVKLRPVVNVHSDIKTQPSDNSRQMWLAREKTFYQIQSAPNNHDPLFSRALGFTFCLLPLCGLCCLYYREI